MKTALIAFAVSVAMPLCFALGACSAGRYMAPPAMGVVNYPDGDGNSLVIVESSNGDSVDISRVFITIRPDGTFFVEGPEAFSSR